MSKRRVAMGRCNVMSKIKLGNECNRPALRREIPQASGL